MFLYFKIIIRSAKDFNNSFINDNNNSFNRSENNLFTINNTSF